MSKTVSQLDADGYYVGPATADESPLEPGVWLIPAGAVDASPPDVPDGQRAVWSGAVWTLEAIPQPEPEPEPTIGERRASAWERVKAERSRRIAGGALAGGHWFHSDMESKIQHMELRNDAQKVLADGGGDDDVLTIAGQPIYWKTLSNGLVPMTVGLAQAIVAAIKVLEALAFARAETLRAQIEASENPETIDISSGWPAIYEGDAT